MFFWFARDMLKEPLGDFSNAGAMGYVDVSTKLKCFNYTTNFPKCYEIDVIGGQ